MIADFCQALGIDATGLDHPAEDQNPSIGGALLEVKRLLNVAVPENFRTRRVYRLLSKVADFDPAFRRKRADGAIGYVFKPISIKMPD